MLAGNGILACGLRTPLNSGVPPADRINSSARASISAVVIPARTKPANSSRTWHTTRPAARSSAISRGDLMTILAVAAPISHGPPPRRYG